MRQLLIRLLYWLLDRLEDDWTDCGTRLDEHAEWLESHGEWLTELTEELRGKK